MKFKKNPIDPESIRTIPKDGFSWIDRKFIRTGIINRIPGEAILLYFFLTAVSDFRGLSFYADPTVLKTLQLNMEELDYARNRLMSEKLILYKYPIYQVLPISEQNVVKKQPSRQSSNKSDLMSLREFFQLTNRKPSK